MYYLYIKLIGRQVLNKTLIMMLNKIVKQKNPSLPFQKKLRYMVTKELKTVYHLRVVEFIGGQWINRQYGEDYKGVKKNSVIEVK